MHTTGAADMVQLEAEANRWLAWIDDVPMGYLYFFRTALDFNDSDMELAAVPFGVYAIVQVIFRVNTWG